MELDFKLHEKLAEKASLAALAYPVLYLVILSFTPIFQDAPGVALTFAGLLVLSSTLRVILARALRKNLTWFSVWKKLLYAAVWLASLTWGTFCYWTVIKYGSTQPTFVVLFPTAGIIGASVISLAPIYLLLQFHILLMVVPIILASLANGDKNTHAYAVLSFIYLGYISAQARATSKVVHRDVEQTMTIRRQKEELEVSWRQAHEAMKVKSDFLAVMSHEIRTPLNGIIGLSDIVLSEDLSVGAKDHLKTIQDCGNVLLTIVNDVLDFSKIDSGKMELDLRKFNVEECLSGALKIFKTAAQKKNVELTFYMDQECPRQVVGDSDRIRQIVVNLVGNAIKFTPQGEVTLEVKAHRKLNSVYEFRLSVRDSGIGIAPEVQKNLFQPFTQGDVSTTRKYGGTGLGLTICKKLVELMKGEMTLTSELGKGSTFTFVIPMEVTETATQPQVSLQPTSSGRILVVEDNLVNQTIAHAMLDKSGYACDIVSNGMDCLERLKTQRYALILMDCQMPEMDGYETTRRIRATPHGKNLPIIAMTANALEGDRARCLAAGMNDYVSKPIKEAVLMKAIKAFLNFSERDSA